MRETFYVTTPIYYPSDRLHIGHAYTTTIADALARYHRLAGRDVFFLTGSDEHGQKIQRRAAEKGMPPQQYVDEIVASFQELWRRLDVSYDDFIRTTEPRHERVVQHIFRRIQEKGDIYKSEYEGWYCTPCETFWLERQLADGKCPDCGRPVELLREESYFFRLSRYQDRLRRHIEEHPEFIQPASRRNEMLKFLDQGLEDLCISRTTFDWGIPVPTDPRHVVYVWFDALSNYLTGVGYLQDEEKFRRYWPADLHLVGKEIVRFHTIIWPIMLMALDLPLPKTVFGHGWLIIEGDKMSKSKGNVVDPNLLIDEFGADAIRYFLLREISFGQDGNFSRSALIQRLNSDLANDLGNLIHRTAAMLEKYFQGLVPEPGQAEDLDLELPRLAGQVIEEYRRCMETYELNEAWAAVWRLIGRANKYIDEAAPWNLARQGRDRLARVMYNLVETIRLVAILIYPAMPSTAQKIWTQLGLSGRVEEAGLAACQWGRLPAGLRVRREPPLFPRIEEEGEAVEAAPAVASTPAWPGGLSGNSASAPQVLSEITIEDFAKLDLRVARVLAAEPVAGADKLLKLQIDLGGEQRQIVAGIARYYRPEELVGRLIVVVANLKPARLKGEISQGMLLAASTEDGAVLGLVVPERPLPPGSRVK